ncbi:ankyrin repeat-containing domain protein [Ochromonadaceae sp. CCMP2298]|nr:ankyrin repeat-containing domain protein [Ochromonadaceae sp. CCMP2298]
MQLTPLQLSAACGHADVVGVLLLSPSVQVNIADPLFSMTALHLAVHLGQLFAVETLCRDSRVEVDLRNLDGKTPIHLAAQARNVGMVETLLRLRPAVDLRVKDFDGNNALHTAAQNPSEAIMRALVQHVSMINFYCDPFDPSDFGKSTKSHSKRTIFETSNCNGESAIQILSEALREERRLRAQQLTAARETTADSAVPPHTTRSTTMGTQSDAAVAMSLTEQPQPAGLRLSVGRNLDVDHMEVEGDQDAPAQHTTTESPTTASPRTSDILRKRRGSFSLPTAPVIPVPAVQEGVVEVAEAQDSSASAAEECERGARDGEAGNAEIGNKLRVDADIAERTAGDEAGERGTCDALRELEQNTRGREHVEEKAAFSWSPANEALLLTLSSSSDSAENGLESGAYYTPDSIHSDY